MKKSKKLIGKSKKELPQTERHFGVILEDIDSKLDLVVEGHQVLDKKIEDFRGEVNEKFKEVDYKFEVVFEKFDEVDKKFDEVDKKFDEVDKRFDEVDKRFDEVDKRFDEVDKRFDEVAGELRVIRHELKEKVGRDEFILLEKRVAALEKSR
jgi:septation ring formation regulator EzrA